MRTGAILPEPLCQFGSDGTAGSTGAALRLAGRVWRPQCGLSGIHSNACPSTVINCRRLSFANFAVCGFAYPELMPSPRGIRKSKLFSVGASMRLADFSFSGSAILISELSASRFRVKGDRVLRRCGPSCSD